MGNGGREAQRGEDDGREGGKGKGRAHLVTANLLGDVIQRLYDPQPELLPLLVFRDGDVFDVAYFAEVVYAASLTSSASASLSGCTRSIHPFASPDYIGLLFHSRPKLNSHRIGSPKSHALEYTAQRKIRLTISAPQQGSRTRPPYPAHHTPPRYNRYHPALP